MEQERRGYCQQWEIQWILSSIQPTHSQNIALTLEGTEAYHPVGFLFCVKKPYNIICHVQVICWGPINILRAIYFSRVSHVCSCFCRLDVLGNLWIL